MTTRILGILFSLTGTLFALSQSGFAQEESEKPYIVTYSSQMEEVGPLEIEVETATGRPEGGNRFFGNPTEFEYGIRHWWTTEFYVDWQHTRHDGSLFTGLRLENRFQLLPGDHRIKPVLYVEYEHLNGADKTLKEIVGFDGQEDLKAPTDTEVFVRSENRFNAELQLTGWTGAEDAAEIGRECGAIRHIEIDGLEQIEDFHPNLQPHTIRDMQEM